MSLTFDHDIHDTIAAVATGSSEAGIGIIRISGPRAGEIIADILHTGQKVNTWLPNTIHYGFIIDPESGQELDEVLVSWFKAPHSYTTEDTAEINTHGGTFVMQRVLSAVFRAGARPADPGEFTKKAFLGGRIDLSEAEAVMDLIHAQSEFSRKISLAQMKGSVSHVVAGLRQTILYETAAIEAALDDPEHYTLSGYGQHLDQVCENLISRMRRILRISEEGSLLASGIHTVIIGKPNAGKSSLLNMLCGRERAIVTAVPGTTRDTLEETVRIGDVVLHLTDTAGIHSTDDEIEQIGILRATKALEQARLILFVVDGSSLLSEEDLHIADLIAEYLREDIHVRCIVLLNKSDLPQKVSTDEVSEIFAGLNIPADRRPGVLSVSLRPDNVTAGNEDSRSAIIDHIVRLFHLGAISESDEPILTGERERAELRNALHSLQRVRNSIAAGLSEEFYSIDLMDAYRSLGRVIGETVEDDLINEIFSSFCMGK